MLRKFFLEDTVIGEGRKKKVFFLALFLLLLCFSQSGYSETLYSRVSGTFSTAGNWSTTPGGAAYGGALQAGDVFFIRNGFSMQLTGSRTVSQLTIQSGGTLTFNGSYTLTSTNPLTVDAGGTITIAANTFTSAGSWVNNGTINISTGQLVWTTNSGTNNATIAISSTGRLVRTTGSFTNSGSITMVAGSLFSGTTGIFNNTATGTLAVTGSATITLGGGNFINSNPAPTAVNFGASQISLTGNIAGQEVGGFSTTGAFATNRTTGNVITVTGDIRCNSISVIGNGAVLYLGDGLTHRLTGAVTLSLSGTVGSDLAGGTSILYVYGGGGVAFTGTGINFRADQGTVVFAGAAAQTLGGTGTGAKTFYNLTLEGAGTKTNAGGITVSNILTYQGATTSTPSTTFTFGPNATLRYNSAVTRTTTSNEWPVNIPAGVLGGGVLIENTGAITLNGSKALGLGIPVAIQTSAVLSMGTNSLTVSDDIINSGALNGTSATNGLVLTGTANQNVGNVNISGPVIAFKPSGTITITGGITAGGLQVQNTGAGALNLGSFTHSFGAFTGTSGSWDAGSSLTTFSGSASYTAGTLTAGSSTISFTGNATQNIPPYVYYNLGLSGSGTKNIVTGTSVDVTNDWTAVSTTNLAGTSNLTVAGTIYGTGNLTMSSGALRIGGTWAKTSGSFTAGTGTVLYYGTTQNVADLMYNSLQIAGAGVKTMAASTTIMSGLIINPSNTLELGTLTLTFTGAGAVFTNNGTFDPGSSSTVLYTGNSGQNITPATYHNLSFTGPATKTIAAGAMLTVNNNWNIHSTTNMITTGSASVTGDIGGAGNITQGTGGTISLSGAWTKSGSLAGTGTVNYNGAAQTISNTGYYNLAITNPGTKTLAGSMTVTGILTVNPASTIDIGGFTLTLSGSGTPLVNSGDFVAGNSSTVHYSTAGSANIAAADYFNLLSTSGTRTLASAGTIGILGRFTPRGTVPYTVTGSTVDFKGSGAQDIPAFRFNKLVVSNAGIKRILATVTVDCQTIDIEDDASVEINADGNGKLNVLQ